MKGWDVSNLPFKHANKMDGRAVNKQSTGNGKISRKTISVC